MTAIGRFSLRLAIYGSVLAYLAGDLLVFNGPLNRRIERSRPDSPESIAAAKARGTVARVFNHQILRSQLDRAVHERLWLEGKRLADVPPHGLNLLRYAALGDLIDQQLLRTKVKYETLTVRSEEVEERLRRFRSRFASEDELLTAMKTQGIADTSALRDRIAARIQQEKWVERRVAPLAEVSEEEIQHWYAENKESVALPERVEVRHIYLSHLGPSADQAQALQAAATALREETKTFPALAAELSEDPASKGNGGSLGWMSRDRLPEDFAVQVFDLPLNEPQVIRTRLGWHLVEVTGRQAAEPQPFEQAHPEIRAALEAVKRRDATREFREGIRRQFEAKNIEIFHDMLAD